MSKIKELLIAALEEKGLDLYEGENEIDIDGGEYTFTISYSLEKEDGDFYSEEYRDDDDEQSDGKYELTINSVYATGEDAEGMVVKIDNDVEFAIRENSVFNVGDEEDSEDNYI